MHLEIYIVLVYIEYKTKDRRLLKGYKLKSTQPDGTVVGSMLYFQGNATLADQMFSDLASFSAAGIEVFIFDYRGYGDSEGRPRLKAIVSDYKEIFESVVAATPEKHFLYGVSFGGIILMNVIGKGIVYDRAVIDSPPSRISTDGCQEKYDPVVNFPENGSRLLFVAGEKDKTISIKKQKELLELAKARGSRVEIRPDFAHHTEDSGNVKQARIELIKSFLVGI